MTEKIWTNGAFVCY